MWLFTPLANSRMPAALSHGPLRTPDPSLHESFRERRVAKMALGASVS